MHPNRPSLRHKRRLEPMSSEPVSIARLLASRGPETRKTWLNGLSPEELEALEYDWNFWGRGNQQWPNWEWHTLLFLAGRGWGKTRTGAEIVRHAVCGATPLAAGSYAMVALV